MSLFRLISHRILNTGRREISLYFFPSSICKILLLQKCFTLVTLSICYIIARPVAKFFSSNSGSKMWFPQSVISGCVS